MILSVGRNVELEVFQLQELYLLPLGHDGLDERPDLPLFLWGVREGEREFPQIYEILEKVLDQVPLEVDPTTMQGVDVLVHAKEVEKDRMILHRDVAQVEFCQSFLA